MIGTPGQIRVTDDQIEGDGDNLQSLVIVTNVDLTGGSLYRKTRTLEIRGGIVTLIGTESTWTASTGVVV